MPLLTLNDCKYYVIKRKFVKNSTKYKEEVFEVDGLTEAINKLRTLEKEAKAVTEFFIIKRTTEEVYSRIIQYND